MFNSKSKDLSSGVDVTNQFNVDTLKIAKDFAEFGAWHALMIHPKLNGFRGYDAVDFNLFKGKY
jgi:hypothetical protein